MSGLGKRKKLKTGFLKGGGLFREAEWSQYSIMLIVQGFFVSAPSRGEMWGDVVSKATKDTRSDRATIGPSIDR